MDQSPASVEEKIIYAAIKCIEEYGIQGTTNRRIAALAGVNSAAINYYFRRKENLIERCMQTTLNNAFDWQNFANLPGDTAQERCVAIFNDLLAGACNYPGITRAHYYDLIASGNYDSIAVEKLNEFINDLVANLEEIGTDLNIEELRLACVQIASAAMLMILAPRMFADLGFNLEDEKTRLRFLQRLVKRLL